MSGPDDLVRLARLGVLLELRETTIGPVLAAVATAGIADLAICASMHGRRLELVLPYHPAALAALSQAPAPAEVAGAQLRVRIDGDAVAVAIAQTSPISPRAAVDDVAPPAAAAAWFDIVDQLTSIGNAQVVARSKFVSEARALLDIHYPDRDREGEVFILEGIDQLAGDIGVTAAQRTLWRRLHPVLSGGRAMSLTTGCTASAVSPYFGLGYPIGSWTDALKLSEGLVLDAGEAGKLPAVMGQLAGVLAVDQIRSLELVLGPHEPPDVMVWVNISPSP